MYLLLSWRNLWRNKKRTIIAAASVFFAVLVAVLMRSAQNGSYDYMIHSAAKIYTGYLQVQGKGYWDNRSLDKSIVIDQKKMTEISHIPHIDSYSPRLESFALVSHGITTVVSQIIGIDPEMETRMSELNKKLVKGEYLKNSSQGILVGKGLAERLKVDMGDSIVIYGQGYHGIIAAARLAIQGIVKLPFPELDNAVVYLPLALAQDVFSAYGRITSLAIMLDNSRNQNQVLQKLLSMFNDKYTVMTWQEMMPDLKQSIELDNAGGIIMLIILYIVIAFGVFGTIMMMTTERTHEFGILISVGMKKIRVVWVTTIETIFLAFLGAIIGALCSIPMIAYLHRHPIPITGDAARAFEAVGVEPIFNFSTDPNIIMHEAIVVLIIALLTATYPIWFIRKLEPVEALHG